MNAPTYGRDYIAASLRKSAKMVEDQIEMEFHAINGRQFVVREEDDGRYFAFEMVPIGRLAHEIPGGDYHYENWTGHAVAKDDPNGYVAAAEAAGIDAGALILGGAGYGVYTRYLSSIEEAADEFARCLRENVRYDDQDRAKMNDPAYNAKLREDEERCRRENRAFNLALHEASTESEHGLFKGLHSMMGPLSDDSKKRLLSFLNAPSEETWDDCARMMVKGGKTMWQLWGEVDPSAPRMLDKDGNWPTIPDADMMREALRALGDATSEDWKATSPRF